MSLQLRFAVYMAILSPRGLGHLHPKFSGPAQRLWLTWPTSTQVLLLSGNPAPCAPQLTSSPWAWAEVNILATSSAEVTVGQKCFSTNSREEEQAHRLYPQEAASRSFPHRDSQFVPFSFVLLCFSHSQEPGALTWRRKMPGSLASGVDGSWGPVGPHGKAET